MSVGALFVFDELFTSTIHMGTYNVLFTFSPPLESYIEVSQYVYWFGKGDSVEGGLKRMPERGLVLFKVQLVAGGIDTNEMYIP